MADDRQPGVAAGVRVMSDTVRRAMDDAHVTGLRQAGYDAAMDDAHIAQWIRAGKAQGYAAAKADVVMLLEDMLHGLATGYPTEGIATAEAWHKVVRWAISIVKGMRGPAGVAPDDTAIRRLVEEIERLEADGWGTSGDVNACRRTYVGGLRRALSIVKAAR